MTKKLNKSDEAYNACVEAINELDHVERAELRELLSRRFARGRASTALSSHNEAYERVLKGDVRYRFVIDMATL